MLGRVEGDYGVGWCLRSATSSAPGLVLPSHLNYGPITRVEALQGLHALIDAKNKLALSSIPAIPSGAKTVSECCPQEATMVPTNNSAAHC